MMMTLERPAIRGRDEAQVNQLQQLILELMADQRPSMTQAELSRRSGVPKTTLSNLLDPDRPYGRQRPRRDTLDKIAGALHVNPAILHEAAATTAGYEVGARVEIRDPDLRHLVTAVEEDGTDEQKEWLRDVLRGLVRRLPEHDRTDDEESPRGG